MLTKSAIINVMEGAARRAARGLLRDFGEVEHLQVSRKGPADFVSTADLKAENILLEWLTRGRPAYGVLMEEQGISEGADASNRWIVDPLDGTTNFLHGVPQFSISIAHERDGEIVAAVILDPMRDELFWAERNLGAYLNRTRIRVSARTLMADALISTGFPFMGKEKHPAYFRTVEAVAPNVAGIRRFGSAALDLAWLAAGRYDGFWEFGLEPWDMAAGILLVREAGGSVSDVKGRNRMFDEGHILATNTHLHELLGKLVRGAMVEADA